jgi:amino acid adenylation domain-containing protein
MKSIGEFISYLYNLDIKLWLDGDHLHYRIPKAQESMRSSLRIELAERKAEIITFLKQNRVSRSNMSPIQPVPRDKELSLSFAQQGLWFLDQLEGQSATYNVPQAVRLEGSLHITALEQTLREIVQRHEILRTTFSMSDGKPRLVIHPPIAYYPLPITNLEALPEEEQTTEVQRLANKDAELPFDLSKGPLFRATLLQLGSHTYVLLLNMHHIISDVWSIGVLLHELSTIYGAISQGKPSPLPSLPIQYVDFAHWQRQWLTEEFLEKQLHYWKEKLHDAPVLLELPTDHPRPPIQTSKGNHQKFDINKEKSIKIKKLSKENGATLFMTLFAAFIILLGRYSMKDDIVVGAAIANRIHRQIEPLIGFFINILVLRTDLTGKPSFKELLERVKQVALEAYAHQDIPFEQLVEKLQPKRNLSYAPLFQVGFSLQNIQRGNIGLPGITITPIRQERSIARFDLNLQMTETAHGLRGLFEYNTDLFEDATIERMVGHFQTLLTGIVENPKMPIHELPLLTTAEHQQLLAWNDTATDNPKDQCLHKLFEEQVEQTPDAIAVIFEDQQLTYRELNNKANQLAHYLQTLDVKPEVLVGICIKRSLEMVIGLLGILKAGGAYLPLDPTYPAARLAFVLEDAQVHILLTQSNLTEELPETTARVVYLDIEVLTLSQSSMANPSSGISPENLAYVIYTSGSTGKPKGALIAHQGLCNLAQAQIQAFNLQSNSRVLQFASLNFDASVSEIATTLTSGATLQLDSTNQFLPDEQFINLINRQSITHVTLPPSFLAVLPQAKLSGLETMVVAGEACSSELVTKWSSGRKFINAYGPTESTVCATMTECQADGNSPAIGKPIANTQIYILDVNHNPTPLGIPGELCIAGIGLARGYLNRPSLTRKKFIEIEVFGKSQRIYKTGDLARWLPDGNLKYIGRIDHQVKLRGFRIELSEVEHVLCRHSRISEAVVVHNPQDEELNAYLVQKNRVELWPSIAEFYVYDDIVYHSMATHESRNQQYLTAFQRVLTGKTVVEVGPGPEIILSRLALQAGARKIYAIELLEDTYRKAQDTLMRLGMSDKIILIHGDATQVQLPEPVDYCISEIVGSIGGAEGSAVIINSVRRFLTDGCNMIPQRSLTKIAAISLPESQFDYGFSDIAAHYTQKIFEQVGYSFDLRLCVKNMPLTQLISSSDVFEYLDYTHPILLTTSHEICLQFNQNSVFTGLLVWLTLYTDADLMIDILNEQHSWLPVYLPLFTDGITVKTGDRLLATITRRLCDNRFNPDYLLEGALYRQGQPALPIHYHSYHFNPHYRDHPFYQKLFAHDIVPVLSKLDTRMFRDYLSQSLPDYMVPSHFTVLDHLPLTPNGKIDRKALSQLSVNIDLSEGEFVAPRTREEKLLADIWANVLGVEQVGIHNNFFDLGGHSLLLIRVHRKLSAFFDQKISMVELFEYPTIHTLAQHLTLKQTKQTTQNRADNRRTRQTSTRQQRQARQKHRSKH